MAACRRVRFALHDLDGLPDVDGLQLSEKPIQRRCAKRVFRGDIGRLPPILKKPCNRKSYVIEDEHEDSSETEEETELPSEIPQSFLIEEDGTFDEDMAILTVVMPKPIELKPDAVQTILSDANGPAALSILQLAKDNGIQTGGRCGIYIPEETRTTFNLEVWKPMATILLKYEDDITAKVLRHCGNPEYVAFLQRTIVNIDYSQATLVFNPHDDYCFNCAINYAVHKRWRVNPNRPKGVDFYLPKPKIKRTLVKARPIFVLIKPTENSFRELVDFLARKPIKTLFILGEKFHNSKVLPEFLKPLFESMKAN